MPNLLEGQVRVPIRVGSPSLPSSGDLAYEDGTLVKFEDGTQITFE